MLTPNPKVQCTKQRAFLNAFRDALIIDPEHVPSLISTAVVLRRCSNRSNSAIKIFLMDALQHDRFNAFAWYNLGILHKDEVTMLEVEECFETANLPVVGFSVWSLLMGSVHFHHCW
ncbi:ATP-dependent RNA helicase DHX36 [Spatholobus suberectus]|nr:ATP-dependent RNA helicase DHX36 [Spatholobus suberectus]